MRTALKLALLGGISGYGIAPSLFLDFANGLYRNPAGYSRTNYIPNSTMVGATASSLPTGWSYAQGNGITAQVVATGSEFGRNYIDIQISGTATASANPGVNYAGISIIAATSGQVWTGSSYVRQVGGSASGFGSLVASVVAYTSGGAYINQGSFSTTFTSSITRYFSTYTLPATTAFVTSGVNILVANGNTVNGTFRFYQPQLEQAGSPSSDILTTSAPVTVKTYISNNPADVGNLTYTRAGTAYASDASGNLIAFADNVPRITNTGYLAEPSATNIIPWGRDLSNAVWLKRGTGTATFDSAVINPTGALGASLVTVNTFNNDVYQITLGVSGSTYAPGLYIKKITTTGFLRIENAQNSTNGQWTVNLALLSNGWERLTDKHPAVTVNTPFTGYLSLIGIIFYASSGGPLTFNVDFVGLELGTTATSPIPTTTAAVTRPADVGYYTLSSSLSTAYSLAAVGQSNAGSGNFPTLVQLDDGTSNNRAFVFAGPGVSTTQAGIRVDASSVSQINSYVGASFANGQSFANALSVQSSRIAGSTNGSTIFAGSGTVPTVNFLRLGTDNANPLNGTLKSAAVYSSALPDAEVIYRSQGNLS